MELSFTAMQASLTSPYSLCGLIEALQEETAVATAAAFLEAVEAYETEHGKAIEGLIFEDEKVTFISSTEMNGSDKIHAFITICSMMNRQALEQKRIIAKEVKEPNEKYALRIWLTRLGMNGDEFKADRKVLMENLAGYSAFRTPKDQERWKKRQAEKRDAMKKGVVETGI